MDCPVKSLFPKLHKGCPPMKVLGEKEGRSVLVCDTCGLVHVPQSDLTYLERYEGSDYFQKLVERDYKDFDERFLHDVIIAEVRIKNILRITESGDYLLDIGCGDGAFIKRATEEGFKCTGIDLSQWLLDMAKERVEDATFMRGELTDLPLSSYNVITFIDVFEHILNPLEYMKKAYNILTDDGLLVIEMPDTDSDSFARDGIDWVHIKPNEHPYLYNECHIDRLGLEAGFKLIDKIYTIPGRIMLFLEKQCEQGN